MLSDGVNQNKITCLEQFVKLTSQNAAKIFGMYPKKSIIGTLEKSSDADVTMIDLKKEKKFLQNCLVAIQIIVFMKAKNLKGWPVKTFVRGELVADNFEVVGKLGHGKLVERFPNHGHLELLLISYSEMIFS